MATVRQVEAHQAIVDIKDSRVGVEVGGRAREWLHVDTPFGGIQAECLQSSVLAKYLSLVDELVATVISCAWVSFGVFVFGD